jgi:hypothetical protein
MTPMSGTMTRWLTASAAMLALIGTLLLATPADAGSGRCTIRGTPGATPSMERRDRT